MYSINNNCNRGKCIVFVLFILIWKLFLSWMDNFFCVYFKMMLENRNINNIDVFVENKRVVEIVLLLLRIVLYDCKM